MVAPRQPLNPHLQMANFSSAFGFKVYIVPCLSKNVDVDTVTGGVAETGAFINLGVANANLVATDAVVAEGATVEELTVGGADVAATGVTPFELLGLTDASLSTDTSSEEVVTYSDDSGYSQSVATSKSWSLSISGVTDFNDAGYQAMRIAEKNNVAGALRVKIGRTTPAGEQVFGYGTLQSYSESVSAGSVVTYTVELNGYGPLGLKLAGDAAPAPATGGVATLGNFATSVAYALNATGAATAVTGGNGSNAEVTVDTDGSGDVTAATVTVAGTGYQVGDTLTISEDGGTGVATAEVLSIS